MARLQQLLAAQTKLPAQLANSAASSKAEDPILDTLGPAPAAKDDGNLGGRGSAARDAFIKIMSEDATVAATIRQVRVRSQAGVNLSTGLRKVKEEPAVEAAGSSSVSVSQASEEHKAKAGAAEEARTPACAVVLLQRNSGQRAPTSSSSAEVGKEPEKVHQIHLHFSQLFAWASRRAQSS